MKIKVVMVIAICICFFVLLIYGMFVWMSSDNQKLNICAREYGFKERTNWDGGSLMLNYKFEYINETTFACCLKQDYLYEGEIRELNCTSLYDKTSLEEVQER